MTDFHTHNDYDININMSHLQGYIDANYDELVALFGEPQCYAVALPHGGDKVDWEWSIHFDDDADMPWGDGTVATIYNWKNGPGYGGYAMPDRIKTWHIGGFNNHARALVHKVLWDYRQEKYFSVDKSAATG